MQYPGNKIKVLIVDDSMLYREILARGLASDPGIEIVATARDAFEARDMILAHRPDVMTCDVAMPRMDGIAFIRQLLPQYPLPVIVVSTVSEAVFEAMNAGAVDFVAKPDMGAVKDVETFIREMIEKVKIASSAQVVRLEKEVVKRTLDDGKRENRYQVIAIGASTGGTEAIHQLLSGLPASLPGIVIVQHIPPVFSRMFAQRLNATTGFQVKEAAAGDWVEPGKALLAPGDHHMKIKRVGERYRVECFAGEKVNGHCPSVDVLFESVAREAGDKAVGIILTGMGYDGAKGLLAMRKSGARTLGQDEKSSVVYGMPKVAYNIGAVEKQTPLGNMAKSLLALLSGGGASPRNPL